jgi:hypothetical protein
MLKTYHGPSASTSSSTRTRRSRSVCAGASSARRSEEYGAHDGRRRTIGSPAGSLFSLTTSVLLLDCFATLVDVSPWRKSSRISCKRRFAIAIRMRTHGPCFEMRSRRGSDGWRHITLSRSCTPCLRSSRCKSPLPVSSLPSASDLDLEKQGHCTSRRLHVGKVSPRQVLAHAYTSGNGRHLSGGTLFEWMDDSLPALPRCLARLHLVRSSLSCSLCALLTSWCRQTVFYNEGKWVPNSDIWRTIIWMPGWTAFWLATWSLCVSRKSPTSPL